MNRKAAKLAESTGKWVSRHKGRLIYVRGMERCSHWFSGLNINLRVKCFQTQWLYGLIRYRGLMDEFHQDHDSNRDSPSVHAKH